MEPDRLPDGVSRRDLLKAAAVTGATPGLASAGGETGDGPGVDPALATPTTASHDALEDDPFAGFGGTQCKTDRTSDENLPFDTGGNYGGWGGHEYHCTQPGARNNPIVFVHGNTHDACDFSHHATEFLARGYKGDALWSITFREPTSTHPEMRDQLDDFVTNVLDYVDDVETVDVVGHSLGVTGARFWMDDLDRFDVVDTFVGLAGANHGTWTCRPGCDSKPGAGEPCQFIAPECADESGEPLYELNNPDETPGDVDYFTIRGGLDYFYLENPESPELEGANRNVLLEDKAHNATRASQESIDLIYEWTTDVELDETVATPLVSGSREDDGSVFLAGETDRIHLTASADQEVILRDAVPYRWEIVEGSGDVTCVEPHPHLEVQYVYFEGKQPRKEHDVSYVARAPDDVDETGVYSFGPAEVQETEADNWVEVSGTEEQNVVVGAGLAA